MRWISGSTKTGYTVLITVTFAGGPGQIFVDSILVRVTRSDGLKEEKEIPFKDQIPLGASVDLAGTKGSDRVEVYATINGVTYKVRDQNEVYEQDLMFTGRNSTLLRDLYRTPYHE